MGHSIRCWDLSTTVSHYRSPEFNYHFWGLLLCLWLLEVFFSMSRKMQRQYLKVGHNCFHSHPPYSTIHNSYPHWTLHILFSWESVVKERRSKKKSGSRTPCSNPTWVPTYFLHNKFIFLDTAFLHNCAPCTPFCFSWNAEVQYCWKCCIQLASVTNWLHGCENVALLRNS